MSRSWLANVALPLGLLLVYFLVPYDADRAPVGVLLGVLLSVLALGVVGAVIFREVEGGDRRLGVVHLILALEAVLMTFSFAYYLVASSAPGQFAGLHTRLDALYFSTTTLTTVGYGDIHASGQVARGLVTAQHVFNLVVVGAFAALLRERWASGRRSPERAD
ncbi:MAG: potassium channel family protein [Nocardioides sp.]